MSSSSDADERTIREIYFPAFETAVKEAQPWTVMCSYNVINGVYANENKWLLNDVLRDEWGFKGYVMSDWGAVSDRVKGIIAGMDLEMPSSNGINDEKIVAAVKEGKLDEKLVDQACERILNIVYRYVENAKPDTPWDMEAQHQLAAQCAAECMVLLKNEDDILPLNKQDAIAFIGEFAKTPRYQGGGSSHINSFKTTSALEAAEGLNVCFAQGYSVAADCSTEEQLAEAVKAAKAAKVAVVFAGLPDSYESEGYDRTHMHLPAYMDKLIEAVAEANPNTVVVLYNGSPVEMPWVGKVKGILEGYLGGQAVGIATVNVLFGDVNPSGHLAETFPIKLSDNPSYLYFGGEGNRTEYREGVFVGYRYYDKKEMDVLFPFGHGLSYTTFQYSDLKLSASEIKDTDTVTATVKVTNTGKRPGREVVQLYASQPAGVLDKPYQVLAAFAKTGELQPGETETVSLRFSVRDLASFDDFRSAWVLEKGDYTLRLGNSSRSTDAVVILRLDKDAVLKHTVRCLGKPEFTDWAPEKLPKGKKHRFLKVLKISAASLPEQPLFEAETRVEPEAAQLSPEELAYMSVGAFSEKGGALSVIGNAAISVAGAAGETYGGLKDRGIPSLVMADGPAGLKLNGIYVASQDRNSISMGAVTNYSDLSDVEFSWWACNDGVNWKLIKDWTLGSQWINWSPDTFGDYVIVAKARKVDDRGNVVETSGSVSHHPYIVGKCQMPYTGEGGGYLIGFETYDNPNNLYQYEMLILDCTLLAQNLPAWTYSTGKCGVPETSLWTIWQPKYGYYWTLFRVYDNKGNLLDEACFGFENIY